MSLKFSFLIFILPYCINGSLWTALGFGGEEIGERGECTFWRQDEHLNLDAGQLTAFHRNRSAVGKKLKVINNDNDEKSIVVTIIGQDPNLPDGRILDLSQGAFQVISSVSRISFDCSVLPLMGPGTYPSGQHSGQHSGEQGYNQDGYGGHRGQQYNSDGGQRYPTTGYSGGGVSERYPTTGYVGGGVSERYPSTGVGERYPGSDYAGERNPPRHF